MCRTSWQSGKADKLKSFFETYFDFHYGIGLVIGTVIFCGCMIMISKDKMKRGGKISGKEMFRSLALSVYIVCLLGTTILNRTVDDGQGAQLELFWSYRVVFLEQSLYMVKQIFYNILAFVPWGFLVPKRFGRDLGFCKVVGYGMYWLFRGGK